MRTLTAALILSVSFSPAFAQYPLLQVHPDYQGPSGEPGQIKLDGIVTKVSLFHGRSDDEADWHCYIDISPKAATDLSDYLRARGVNVDAAKLDILYSELMALDKYKFTWFDDKFYSADLTSSLLLFKPGSAHPAWDLGVKAVDNQGTEHDFSSFTKLIGARAYLQGPLVNDAAHGTRVEIHPLDSIAFAMDPSGAPISAKRGDAAWPRTYIRWRVGVFANSHFHRIDDENYLNRERTTTWFLDLPTNAVAGGPAASGNITVIEERQSLWDGGHNNTYSGRRWKTLAPWTIAVDPKDGRKKLRITTTMLVPDDFGGIVVRDYIIRVNTIIGSQLPN